MQRDNKGKRTEEINDDIGISYDPVFTEDLSFPEDLFSPNYFHNWFESVPLTSTTMTAASTMPCDTQSGQTNVTKMQGVTLSNSDTSSTQSNTISTSSSPQPTGVKKRLSSIPAIPIPNAGDNGPSNLSEETDLRPAKRRKTNDNAQRAQETTGAHLIGNGLQQVALKQEVIAEVKKRIQDDVTVKNGHFKLDLAILFLEEDINKFNDHIASLNALSPLRTIDNLLCVYNILEDILENAGSKLPKLLIHSIRIKILDKVSQLSETSMTNIEKTINSFNTEIQKNYQFFSDNNMIFDFIKIIMEYSSSKEYYIKQAAWCKVMATYARNEVSAPTSNSQPQLVKSTNSNGSLTTTTSTHNIQPSQANRSQHSQQQKLILQHNSADTSSSEPKPPQRRIAKHGRIITKLPDHNSMSERVKKFCNILTYHKRWMTDPWMTVLTDMWMKDMWNDKAENVELRNDIKYLNSAGSKDVLHKVLNCCENNAFPSPFIKKYVNDFLDINDISVIEDVLEDLKEGLEYLGESEAQNKKISLLENRLKQLREQTSLIQKVPNAGNDANASEQNNLRPAEIRKTIAGQDTKPTTSVLEARFKELLKSSSRVIPHAGLPNTSTSVTVPPIMPSPYQYAPLHQGSADHTANHPPIRPVSTAPLLVFQTSQANRPLPEQGVTPFNSGASSTHSNSS
jgi:hypothetical protein